MTTPRAVTPYDLYDLAYLPATFTSTDGITVADPSTILCFTKNPLGTVATYQYGAAAASIVRLGVGAYFKEFTVDVVGSWFYRWHGTGGVQDADEWCFVVAPTFIL